MATRPREEYAGSTKVGRLLRPSPETAGQLDDDHQFAVPASLQRVWDASPSGVRRSLQESLQRLGLDRVDVLYLHDPEEHDLDAALRSAVPELVRLREEGLVRALGVGSKSTAALLAAVRTDALDVVMVAGRYTLLEQPAADALLPECQVRGVEVVGAAVYSSGVLSAPCPAESARYEYAPVPADVLARVRARERVCRAHGVELPVAALQFPLRSPPSAPWWSVPPTPSRPAGTPPGWRPRCPRGSGRPCATRGWWRCVRRARTAGRRPPARLGPRRARYAWLTPAAGAVHRTFSPEQAAAELRACGVPAAVLVQAEDSERYTELMLAAADAPVDRRRGRLGGPGAAPRRVEQLDRW